MTTPRVFELLGVPELLDEARVSWLRVPIERQVVWCYTRRRQIQSDALVAGDQVDHPQLTDSGHREEHPALPDSSQQEDLSSLLCVDERDEDLSSLEPDADSGHREENPALPGSEHREERPALPDSGHREDHSLLPDSEHPPSSDYGRREQQ